MILLHTMAHLETNLYASQEELENQRQRYVNLMLSILAKPNTNQKSANFENPDFKLTVEQLQQLSQGISQSQSLKSLYINDHMCQTISDNQELKNSFLEAIHNSPKLTFLSYNIFENLPVDESNQSNEKNKLYNFSKSKN